METIATDLAAVIDALRDHADLNQTDEALSRAASAVLRRLRERGWASLQDVGRIIASVPGQSVTLTDQAMRSDWEVHRMRDGMIDRVFVTEQR